MIRMTSVSGDRVLMLRSKSRPGDVREAAVDDGQVHRPRLADTGEGILAAVDPVHVVAVLPQDVAHGLPDDRVVVCESLTR